MVDFMRVSITDDNFIRGAARVLWAAITQTFPTYIGDIVNLSTYDAMSGWNDLGATKTGVTITINNTEETFDVDQIYTEIASQPTAWSAEVVTALAEVTLEHIQFAWEGGTIATNSSPSLPERNMGIGASRTYTQRRLAIVHQRTNDKLRAVVLRKVQRTPQESSLGHAKTGEQQTIPVRFRALADTSIANERDRFGVIFDQT